MNHKSYSQKNTNYPGPWGAPPEYYCDVCININSPKEATEKFKKFLIDIVWNGKHKDLIIINSFLRTLHYDFYIWHHNWDSEKIWNELENLHKKLENESFRQEFISRIQKYIIEKVSDEDLESFWPIFADFNSREIDLDEILNAVDNMDEGACKSDTFGTKIFWKLF